MADSIEERLLDGTFKPGSVDLAILVDKKAALDGDASMIIEHRHTLDASPDAFVKRLDALKKAKIVNLPDLESATDCTETTGITQIGERTTQWTTREAANAVAPDHDGQPSAHVAGDGTSATGGGGGSPGAGSGPTYTIEAGKILEQKEVS
jgi:hypothetical protein